MPDGIGLPARGRDLTSHFICMCRLCQATLITTILLAKGDNEPSLQYIITIPFKPIEQKVFLSGEIPSGWYFYISSCNEEQR